VDEKPAAGTLAWNQRIISRRRILRTAGLSAGAAAFLAACGGNSANKNAPATRASGTAPSSTSGSAGTAAAKASATAAASDVQVGGNLIFAATRDVTTLDGHVGSLGDEVNVYSGLYDSSLIYDDNAQIIPNIAEKFEYPDNTTIVLHYRSGVSFHDGETLNATTVKANLDRFLDPATASPGGASLQKKLAKIEVVDQATVKFTLAQPDATALASVAGVRMISAGAMTKFGKDLARNPVGSGAFKFKDWLKDDHLTMERFDKYWNASKAPVRVPRVDVFTFKPIVEPSVMLSNLKTRNISIASSVQPVDFGALKSESGITAVERTPSSSVRMYLNLTQAPTDNLKVRQAVDMAIDRDAIGKAFYFGLGQPARSIFSPTNWMYPKDRPIPKRDVNGAKAKLKEAGLDQGLKLDMILPASEPYRTIAQVLQASLAEAGMTINIKQLESGQFLESLKTREGHLALDSIGNRNDPDGFFSGNFKADSPFNFAGFNDPEFEKALADGLLLTDQAQRRTIYQKAEQRLLDVVPGIFLYNPPGLYAQLKEVQEYKYVDFVGAIYDLTWLKKS
jgi:peptide/nickel transport system substrate-binding protein